MLELGSEGRKKLVQRGVASSYSFLCSQAAGYVGVRREL